MRTNILAVSLISAAFLLASCTTNKETYRKPEFPIEKQLASRIITPADSLLIQYAYGLYVDTQNIYVLTLKDGKWLHAYDKQSGKLVATGVPYGQGPGEITSGIALSFNEKEQTFDIYDERLQKLFSYHYDCQTRTFLFSKDHSFPASRGIIRRAWDLNNNTFLTDAQQGRINQKATRFQIYQDDSLSSSYNFFPIADEQALPIFLLSSAASLSPDRTRLATGTLYGGILETFALEGSHITPLATRYFYPPHVRFEEGTVQPIPSETVYGFSSIYAGNDQIYAVLIGEKDPNRFNKICVFDWKGQEITQYHTDCLVFSLSACQSEDNTLYAIAFSREEGFYLVSFNLENTINQ